MNAQTQILELANEEILFRKDNLTVTNYRIRYDDNKTFCSILLLNISSISMIYKRHYFLLIIAFWGFAIPFYLNGYIAYEIYITCLIVAILSIILYIYTTKRKLRIYSNGGDFINYSLSNTEALFLTNIIENARISYTKQ